MSALRQQVADAVGEYIAARRSALGKRAPTLASSMNLFEEGVLDSVALTGLIAAVEQATGREIDFIDVDPDALGTVESVVDELSRAVEPR
jgi:acyl carrier protein